MSTVEKGLESQIRNIEQQYGKTLAEWRRLVKESGLTKHTAIVAMLKTEHGMSHGAAHRVSLKARETGADSETLVPVDPVDELYSGKKASLRPLHEALMAIFFQFGDIEIAPKKGYLSLRRKKQFAMIQPAAARIDLGLILRGITTEERLESAADWNALFTHRVRLSSLSDLDAQLTAWLKKAYDLAQ